MPERRPRAWVRVPAPEQAPGLSSDFFSFRPFSHPRPSARFAPVLVSHPSSGQARDCVSAPRVCLHRPVSTPRVDWAGLSRRRWRRRCDGWLVLQKWSSLRANHAGSPGLAILVLERGWACPSYSHYVCIYGETGSPKQSHIPWPSDVGRFVATQEGHKYTRLVRLPWPCKVAYTSTHKNGEGDRSWWKLAGSQLYIGTFA